MTPATEKAAPIPALLPCPFCGSSSDELMLFCDPDEASDNSGPSRRIQCACCNVEAPFYPTKAEAITAWNTRADREARPSLPDSREEQIRAEAAEDERDRLYAEACRPVPDNEENETVAALACAAATWLRLTQGVQPTARARQGGNNG